jgi:hypothetical protein
MGIRVIGEQIVDNGWWQRFRFLCERDALYIVAMAQASRDIERQQRQNKRKEAADDVDERADDVGGNGD